MSPNDGSSKGLVSVLGRPAQAHDRPTERLVALACRHTRHLRPRSANSVTSLGFSRTDAQEAGLPGLLIGFRLDSEYVPSNTQEAQLKGDMKAVLNELVLEQVCRCFAHVVCVLGRALVLVVFWVCCV